MAVTRKIARCVWRARLWGYDEYAGKDYSHRKDWVLERLAKLSSIFAHRYLRFRNHVESLPCWWCISIRRELRPGHLGEFIDHWTILFSKPTLVDLNPIRAGVAETQGESGFTSGFVRIRELKSVPSEEAKQSSSARIPLRSFACSGQHSAIPYTFADYLQLVDGTGRCVRSDKRGSIAHALPTTALRLGIDSEVWQRAMRPHGNAFGRAMGKLSHMRLHANTLGQSWVRGQATAKQAFG